MGLGALTLALLGSLGARGVCAQDAPVRLRWEAPAGCPNSEELQESVEERLGEPVFGRAGEEPAFSVHGAIVPGDGAPWEARIALVDPAGEVLGERVVIGRDTVCARLGGALAIIVSLLVTQHRHHIVLYAPSAAPEVATEGDAMEASPVEASPVEATPAEASEPRSGPTFGFHLGATVRGLALPGPAFGLRQVLLFGWGGVPLTIAAEAQLVPPFSYVAEDAGSEFWYWSAGLTLCPLIFEEEVVRTVTCAGVMAGQSHAQGIGLDLRRSSEQVRVDVVIRLGASFRLVGPLRLSVVALVDVPLIQHVFTFGPPDAEQVLFEGLPLSLGLSVSLGLSFPEP